VCIVDLSVDLRTQLRIVAVALLVFVTLFFLIRLRSERRQRKAKEESRMGALVLAVLIALLALAGFAVYHFGGPEIIHALRRWGR
jgi:multisubunit Na+/H+ antiporter MnhB subunit